MSARRRSAKKAAGKPRFVFRLYIIGDAPHSVAAVANLAAICHDHLQDNSRVEIVDVLEHPRRILSDRILATPTLVKVFPLPTQRIIGDLSEKTTVLTALGIS